MDGGRVLDLQLHLLDRQVVDGEGRMVCKVDDLELALDERGRPYVTAILVGPRALGPRLGGRLGRWMVAVAGRLAGGAAPPRIDFGRVTDIGCAVTVAGEPDVVALEDWVDEHLIARIPGSTDAGQ
jgi:sporulation protein YlmC with PRC-barrel domain